MRITVNLRLRNSQKRKDGKYAVYARARKRRAPALVYVSPPDSILNR